MPHVQSSPFVIQPLRASRSTSCSSNILSWFLRWLLARHERSRVGRSGLGSNEPPLCLGPCEDFGKFDLRFACPRSGQKFRRSVGHRHPQGETWEDLRFLACRRTQICQKSDARRAKFARTKFAVLPNEILAKAKHRIFRVRKGITEQPSTQQHTTVDTRRV